MAWDGSSIFTGQVDDVVGEVELDGVEREIGVRDLFAKDHVSVAVVTGEGGGVIGPDDGSNGSRVDLPLAVE